MFCSFINVNLQESSRVSDVFKIKELGKGKQSDSEKMLETRHGWETINLSDSKE